MGHSFTMLTAALLLGQTTSPDDNGKSCPCKNGMQSGSQTRVYTLPDGSTETRTTSWWNWRSSGATTSSGTSASGMVTSVPQGVVVQSSGPLNSNATTSGDSAWRTSNTTQGSWIDNRPVLSRIKGWFNRGDNSNSNTNMRTERVEPIPVPKRGEVILEPGPGVPESYRRLPTTNEPPLAAPVPMPASPRNVAPAPIRPVPVAPSVENPPVIEIEPISFRPAGQPRGVVNAAQTSEVSKTSESSQRPNLISPRFTEKVGQPGDYSWITGQLEIRGNTFLLHYATPETIDRFGGSIVLGGVRDANNLRHGDLVSAHGAVVEQPGRAPLYQVTAVDLVER